MDYEIILRFLLAALWGGIVGAEREYRSKTAGFRTMIMISLGSCIYTMMSVNLGIDISHDRIASNIVTGVGFLGAGVIFLEKNRVSGITTAATIWAVAAIGMSIGAGRYFEAGAASILIVIVLAILPYAEGFLDKWNVFKSYTISLHANGHTKDKYEEIIKQLGLKYKLVGHIKETDQVSYTWHVFGHADRHKKLVERIEQDEKIYKFSY